MQNMTVHKLKNVFLGAFKNYEKKSILFAFLSRIMLKLI